MMAQEQEFLKGQPQMDELAAFVRRSPAFGWPLEGRELTAWRQVLGHGFEAIGGLAMCTALAALRLDVTGARRSESRPGSRDSLTRQPKRRRAAALIRGPTPPSQQRRLRPFGPPRRRRP